jgi:hypothetical protein
MKCYDDEKKCDKDVLYNKTVYIDNEYNIVEDKDIVDGKKYHICENGIIHDVSVSFSENKNKINELRTILRKIAYDISLIITNKILPADTNKGTFCYRLLQQLSGKDYYDEGKKVLEMIAYSFLPFRDYKTFNRRLIERIVQDVIDKNSNINQRIKESKISTIILGGNYKKSYIYRDESQENNIKAFISKLVARRVSLYIYKKCEKEEKDVEIKEIYGFFSKSGSFGSHDLDLNLRDDKGKKLTIEESNFLGKPFPHIKSSPDT